MLVDLSDPSARDPRAFDLFCFPYAGGKPEAFRRWAERAPPKIRMIGVTLSLQASDDPAEAPLTMAALVGAIADRVMRRGHRQYGFYGHSMGALVAFETARELRRRGYPSPRILLCGATPAPDRLRWRPDVARLSDRDLLIKCRAHFTHEESPVDEIGEWERELIRPLRGHLALLDEYVFVPEPPLDVPIRAIAGARDPSLDPWAALTWAQHTSANFRRRIVDGGHYFVNDVTRELPYIVFRDVAIAARSPTGPATPRAAAPPATAGDDNHDASPGTT